MHLLRLATFLLIQVTLGTHADKKTHKRSDAAHNEVVVPKKVTHDGKFVSHSIPHEYKRSFYASRKIQDDDKVHYHVPIGNRVHHVELWPNHEMMSPGLVVETRKGDESVDFRKGTDVSCHYQGRVKGHGERRSAISTCEGLKGVLRTKTGSYLIEPSASHEIGSIGQHPHFLYRIEDEDQPNCGNRENAKHALAKRGLRTGGLRTERNVTKSGGAVSDGRLYLETLLVLDRTLIDFHGVTDVENYALTVVNMAYTLYHEDTLDVRVSPIVVRIIRLEDDEKEMNTKISPNARITLDHFCAWQHKMNPGDDNHPNHHDVALLITRVDICADESNCGLLGLARMAGACDAVSSCALAEDNGLKLGYVVAHELAHTLGVDHDVKTGVEGCEGRLPDGFTTVMNPAISMKTEEWTKCSSEDLRAFLQSGFAKCLSDEPADHAYNIQDMLPGVMYGGDYQCRSLVSQQAVECEMGLTCDSLNCEVPGYGCMETHVMPAPGTACGERKWCYQRRCLELGERPGAVDGGWGAWGPWGTCSRSCGSGVSVAERDCNNPTPSKLGKFCVGERKRHRVCATQPCPPDSVSFRDAQCAEFNDWVYPEDGRTHTWTAHYMHDENPCALFCKNERDTIAMLRPKVVDGTSCMRGHRDLCIGGSCREVPCDMDLESHAVEDLCGICHGDGTECYVKDGSQTFDEDPSALKKFVDVPIGTRNVHVDELEPTHALIVVRGEDQQEPYVKGDKLGMFEVPGSLAWLGMSHLRQESLHIPGPTSKPLTILVRPIETVTLSYSMALRRDKKRCVGGCYSWDFVSWSSCSAQCGPGEEVAVPRCVERQGGLVEDVYCKHLDRPDEKNRPCFLQPCVARWMVGDWQKDCKDCTPGDTSCARTRSVVCSKPAGEGEGETDLVADRLCSGPKPHDVELCPMATTASHVSARGLPVDGVAPKLIAILQQTKQDTVTDFLFDGDPRGTEQRETCQEDDDIDDTCVHGPTKKITASRRLSRRQKRDCEVTTSKPLKAKFNRGQTVVDSVDVADFHISFSPGRDGNSKNASMPSCVSGVEALKLLGRLQATDRKEQEKTREEHAKQRDRRDVNEHQVSLLDIELDSERDDDLQKIEDFDQRPLDRRADEVPSVDGLFDGDPVGDVSLDLGVGDLGTQAVVASVLEDTDKMNRGEYVGPGALGEAVEENTKVSPRKESEGVDAMEMSVSRGNGAPFSSLLKSSAPSLGSHPMPGAGWQGDPLGQSSSNQFVRGGVGPLVGTPGTSASEALDLTQPIKYAPVTRNDAQPIDAAHDARAYGQPMNYARKKEAQFLRFPSVTRNDGQPLQRAPSDDVRMQYLIRKYAQPADYVHASGEEVPLADWSQIEPSRDQAVGYGQFVRSSSEKDTDLSHKEAFGTFGHPRGQLPRRTDAEDIDARHARTQDLIAAVYHDLNSVVQREPVQQPIVQREPVQQSIVQQAIPRATVKVASHAEPQAGLSTLKAPITEDFLPGRGLRNPVPVPRNSEEEGLDLAMKYAFRSLHKASPGRTQDQDHREKPRLEALQAKVEQKKNKIASNSHADEHVEGHQSPGSLLDAKPGAIKESLKSDAMEEFRKEFSKELSEDPHSGRVQDKGEQVGNELAKSLTEQEGKETHLKPDQDSKADSKKQEMLDPYRGYADISERALKRMQEHTSRMDKLHRTSKEVDHPDSEQREGALYFGDLPQRELDIIEAMGAIHRDRTEPGSLSKEDKDSDLRSWQDIAVVEGGRGRKSIEKRDSGELSRSEDTSEGKGRSEDVARLADGYERSEDGLQVRYLTLERRKKRKTGQCVDRPHKVHANVRKGEVVSDSEDVADVKLTFVDDNEQDLRSGRVVPNTQVQGKQALKLIDEMQKRARTKAPAQAKDDHDLQCPRN